MHMKTLDPHLSHFDIIGRFVPETIIIILVSLTQKYCLHVCPNRAHFENFVPKEPFPIRPTPYLQVRRRPTSSRWCAQGGGTRTSPRRDPTSSSTSLSSTRYGKQLPHPQFYIVYCILYIIYIYIIYIYIYIYIYVCVCVLYWRPLV